MCSDINFYQNPPANNFQNYVPPNNASGGSPNNMPVFSEAQLLNYMRSLLAQPTTQMTQGSNWAQQQSVSSGMGQMSSDQMKSTNFVQQTPSVVSQLPSNPLKSASLMQSSTVMSQMLPNPLKAANLVQQSAVGQMPLKPLNVGQQFVSQPQQRQAIHMPQQPADNNYQCIFINGKQYQQTRMPQAPKSYGQFPLNQQFQPLLGEEYIQAAMMAQQSAQMYGQVPAGNIQSAQMVSFNQMPATQVHSAPVIQQNMLLTPSTNLVQVMPQPITQSVPPAVSSQTVQESQPRYRSPIKPKRSRIMFTQHQLQVMRAEFKVAKYLSRQRKHELASQLKMKVNNLKVWFQNQRMKEVKMMKKKLAESKTGETVGSPAQSSSSNADVVQRLMFYAQDVNKMAQSNELHMTSMPDSLNEFLDFKKPQTLVQNNDQANSQTINRSNQSIISDSLTIDDCNMDVTIDSFLQDDKNPEYMINFDLFENLDDPLSPTELSTSESAALKEAAFPEQVPTANIYWNPPSTDMSQYTPHIQSISY